MANPFIKAWKYLMALVQLEGRRVRRPEGADPAGHRGRAASAPGAVPAGRGRDRQPAPAGDEAEPAARRHREAAGQRPPGAHARRPGQRATGDAAKATEYNNAAEAFAAQLVTAEQSVEDLKALHDQALQAAGQAEEGRRAERDGAAAEDRRAHQAAQPARAGQDAGAGERVAALDERDRRARQHPQPRRGPRQDRTALRQRDGRRRARTELGAGPHDGGAAGQRPDGRALAARADPRVDARRRAARRAVPQRPPRLPPTRRRDAGKPALRNRFHEIQVREHGGEAPDGATGGLAHAGAAWRRHRCEFTDVVAQKLGAAADPRAKLLRKRRWALRATLFFAFSTGSLDRGDGGARVVGRDTRVGAADPGSDRRGRGVPGDPGLPALPMASRRAPLPPERSVRRLPPWGSAARQPMAALASAERGLVLAARRHGARSDAARTTNSRGDGGGQPARRSPWRPPPTRWCRWSGRRTRPRSRAHTWRRPSGRSPLQLDNGVRQYNEMVTAAAQLVSSANSGSMSSSPMSAQRYRHELVAATDRLAGWAQAFDELGHLRRA